MKHEQEGFAFSYSAKEQEEVRKIRAKYLPQEADPMEQLRRLDESVTRKGTVISLILGVLSALLLGTGMSCCMVWGGRLFPVGIAVGLAGILGIALAYPVYQRITDKERKRLAPEILRLSEALLKGMAGFP